MGEMTIEEWLDRLNLLKYMSVFVKNKVTLVKELKTCWQRGKGGGSFHDGFDFGNTEQNDKDKARVCMMVRNVQKTRDMFEY